MTVYRIKIVHKRTGMVLIDTDFDADSNSPTYAFATAWMLSGASLDPEDADNYASSVIPVKSDFNAPVCTWRVEHYGVQNTHTEKDIQ